MNPAVWGPQASSCTPLQTTGPLGPDRVTKTTHDAAGQVTVLQTAYGTADQANEAGERVQRQRDGGERDRRPGQHDHVRI